MNRLLGNRVESDKQTAPKHNILSKGLAFGVAAVLLAGCASAEAQPATKPAARTATGNPLEGLYTVPYPQIMSGSKTSQHNGQRITDAQRVLAIRPRANKRITLRPDGHNSALAVIAPTISSAKLLPQLSDVSANPWIKGMPESDRIGFVVGYADLPAVRRESDNKLKPTHVKLDYLGLVTYTPSGVVQGVGTETMLNDAPQTITYMQDGQVVDIHVSASDNASVTVEY